MAWVPLEYESLYFVRQRPKPIQSFAWIFMEADMAFVLVMSAEAECQHLLYQKSSRRIVDVRR